MLYVMVENNTNQNGIPGISEESEATHKGDLERNAGVKATLTPASTVEPGR